MKGIGIKNYLNLNLNKKGSPKNCPYRRDEAVHERRGDIPPFPRIPARRLGHGEFTDPGVHQSEKPDGAPGG